MLYLTIFSTISLSVLSYIMGFRSGRTKGYRDGYQDGRSVKFNNPLPKSEDLIAQKVRTCKRRELKDPVWMG